MVNLIRLVNPTQTRYVFHGFRLSIMCFDQVRVNSITNMLFMLNIIILIIIYINFNDRINKQVIRDVSCYLITN